jgi:hypothetical protein
MFLLVGLRRSFVRRGPLLACLLTAAVSVTVMQSNDAGSQHTASDAGRESRRLEILMGFRVAGERLHFRVATGGCTSADDFRLDVEEAKEEVGHIIVTLHRIRIDSCKGHFPDGTEITFATDALGISPGQRILVRNPFGALGGP